MMEMEAFAGRFAFERRLWSLGYRLVAGVDEAGRGPLAGPVVAAAVILHPGCFLPGLDDSKRLSAAERERLVPLVKENALAWGVSMASVGEIDRHNIAQATFLAMRRAVSRFATPPDHLLVDGFPIPGLSLPQKGVIGGDGLSNSIAAASVLAKVYRDRVMEIYGRLYPDYGFEVHKGYPTAAHREAIARLGPCPLHRLSFRLLPEPGRC